MIMSLTRGFADALIPFYLENTILKRRKALSDGNQREYEKLVALSLTKIGDCDIISQNEILNHLNTSNENVVKSIQYYGGDEEKAQEIKELDIYCFR